MKELALMFGLFSLFLISTTSLVFGRTHSPFCQSSIVSTIVGAYTRAIVHSPVINRKQEPGQESLFEIPKAWKETVITPNDKRDDSSFTKASSQQIVFSLSTSFVAQSQLNELIKSSLSTNVLPASFSSRYVSLNAKNSVLNGHEKSFATWSIPFYTIPPEIISSSSQVNGINKPSLSRDKTHLPTSQQKDKSLFSSLEAFTKSAFSYPRRQFTRSSSILVRRNSLYGAAVSFDKAKMFAKGSVTLTNGPSTLSVGSTIRKTAELKLLSEATSPYLEAYQHSMEILDTKISSQAIKVNFSGIYGISQTTAKGKMTSPFISTVSATEVPTISVKASAAHRPPSMNQRNSSSSLSVMASPVVSSKISNDTMVTFTTPLTQPSVVTMTSSKFPSRSKAKFRTWSEKNTDSDIHRWSTILTPTSTSYRTSAVALTHSHQSDGALKESVSSFVPQGPLRSSELPSFPEKDYQFTEGMRTLPSRQSEVPKTPVASVQLGTTVILSGNMSTSLTPDVAENLPTGQPTTTTDELSNIKLLVIVATVPSIVLCAFFTAVMLLRRNRRRKNNFKYSIKLEYKDSLRSRCVNSRLDLSLKEIHIDLELPNISNDRRDSNDCSRRTSLSGTQIRELQILSQECKENLEWISQVIARDMETSICPRKSINRDSVYSIKEKGSYEQSAKIIRRESSKRGRETITFRVPIVRRRDSGEFDQNDSICTDDTTLTSNSDWKDERDLERAKCNRVDKGSKIMRTPSHVNEGRRAAPPNKNVDEIQGQGKETKETELEEKKQNNTLNSKNPQVKRSGRRFETL